MEYAEKLNKSYDEMVIKTNKLAVGHKKAGKAIYSPSIGEWASMGPILRETHFLTTKYLSTFYDNI